MNRSIKILILVVLLILLAGCGGGDNDKDEDSSSGETPVVNTPESTPVPQTTFYAPAPRSHALPDVKPYDFEAPFSVATFIRQSAQGRTTSPGNGGLQATYQQDQNSVVMTVYHFETADEAARTVQFTLQSGSMVRMVEPIYVGPAIVFGIAEDRHGGYLAAWSHESWCFLVATPNGLDVLNSFLESFPY